MFVGDNRTYRKRHGQPDLSRDFAQCLLIHDNREFAGNKKSHRAVAL